MNALAAHGGPRTLTIEGPHYRWPAIDGSLEEAVLKQLHRSLSDKDGSGIIGEYEAAFAAFLGVLPTQVVSFASGTAAIHAMGRICGLKPGDAIIAPAYTFPATASPFGFDGIEVLFADADEYGNVTAHTLADRMQPNVKAVIVTHMWGNPCQMSEITAFCTDQDLLLLEDCSHAHFARWRGQRAGTFGNLAVFSTNQKAITTGEGGILVARDRQLRDLAMLYAHYNKRSLNEISSGAGCRAYAFTGMGLKERMTTIGAAIGVHQVGLAAAIEARRRAVLDTFVKSLDSNPVITVSLVPPEDGLHGLYVIGLQYHPANAAVSRDEFVRLCLAEGAVEVDVPGSTRDLSREPLFARRDPYAPWDRKQAPASWALPGVAAFQDTFVKIPIWGYPGDQALVDGYLAALAKVSAAVAR